jgi:exodeoxyribonuclease V alpha subunit
MWMDDPKWGNQLTNCTVEELRDKESIIEYLCTIDGVGPKTAEMVVDEFGEESFYADIEKPDAIDKLTAIRQITPERANNIVAYVKHTEQQRQLWELFSRHGIASFSAVLKIFKRHGENAYDIFRRDPYTVGLRAGLSFSSCDAIAIGENLPPSSPIRIKAAVLSATNNAASNGHSYINYGDLVTAAQKKLNPKDENFTKEMAAPAIGLALNALLGDEIIKEGDAVYLTKIRKAEIEVASMVKSLLRTAAGNKCDSDELCKYAEKALGVSYADKQRDAFGFLAKGGLCIITGGPGTGKTTVLKGLLAAYEKLYPKKTIKLCAPTGRASQRMREVTGREAVTVHRLLEYKPYGVEVIHKNRHDPIDADLLVIDEGSMLNIETASLLFQAIKPGTMAIICGDVNQLPAVGAGNVLHDLIHSGIVPVVALTKTHRQASGSAIITNAHRIESGAASLFARDDFEIIEAEDKDMPAVIERELIKHHDPKDVFACQVLTPARKKSRNSMTNSTYLNDAVQLSINPTGASIRYGDTTFRVGDKVMTMRNNYEDGYYNGDVGVIKEITDSAIKIEIEGGDITVEQHLFDDVSLAYVTTVHKSQGSEYRTAIVVLPSAPKNMLQRNLFYTAVTRAKEKVVLIAAKNTISTAIANTRAVRRNSKLIERLQGKM